MYLKMARAKVLTAEEYARRQDACKRRWLVENYEYNRFQNNCSAVRPEYLARRRELHQLRKARTTSELPRAENNSPDETVIADLDKAWS